MRILFRIIVLVLCCFICSSFSKMKEEHVNDMWSVFPFRVDEKNKANQKVNDFFVDVHSYLDYCDYPLKVNDNSDRRRSCNNLCELIQSESCPFGAKNVSKGEHRIFYHWGWIPEVKYVQDDSHFEYLDYLVKSSCNGENTCIEAFWDSFNKVKQKRDQHLQDQYAVLLGKNKFSQLSKRDQKIGNAFIRIAYTVHVLGDYTTNQGNDKTQEFSSILEDIKAALTDLSPSDRASVNDFICELRTVADSNPADSKEIGEKSLRLLSAYFTHFLYKSKSVDYKRMFKNLGYKLK